MTSKFNTAAKAKYCLETLGWALAGGVFVFLAMKGVPDAPIDPHKSPLRDQAPAYSKR